jgi:hypothetical protein
MASTMSTHGLCARLLCACLNISRRTRRFRRQAILCHQSGRHHVPCLVTLMLANRGALNWCVKFTETVGRQGHHVSHCVATTRSLRRVQHRRRRYPGLSGMRRTGRIRDPATSLTEFALAGLAVEFSRCLARYLKRHRRGSRKRHEAISASVVRRLLLESFNATLFNAKLDSAMVCRQRSALIYALATAELKGVIRANQTTARRTRDESET